MVDYGLARIRQETSEAPSLSESPDAPTAGEGLTNGSIGTRFYKAPEQSSNSKRVVDARTDVWGLGVILFELLWAGQSPGKRVVGIRVVQTGGFSLRFPDSLIRNLLRTVDFIPLFYGVGLLSLLLTRHCQRIGDIDILTLQLLSKIPLSRPNTNQQTPRKSHDSGNNHCQPQLTHQGHKHLILFKAFTLHFFDQIVGVFPGSDLFLSQSLVLL